MRNRYSVYDPSVGCRATGARSRLTLRTPYTHTARRPTEGSDDSTLRSAPPANSPRSRRAFDQRQYDARRRADREQLHQRVRRDSYTERAAVGEPALQHDSGHRQRRARGPGQARFVRHVPDVLAGVPGDRGCNPRVVLPPGPWTRESCALVRGRFAPIRGWHVRSFQPPGSIRLRVGSSRRCGSGSSIVRGAPYARSGRTA